MSGGKATRTMRAMAVEAAGPIGAAPLRERRAPVPRPGPGEVLLQVACCGVCHTDLHIVEGEVASTMPRVPGHQIVGRVAERGEGARRFETGERVGVPWLYSTCGRCRFCASGRENLCAEARFTGLDVDGGYAEYVAVREDFACRLPESFADVNAAPLLCAGIIGYRALARSGLRPGGRLGLYGFGASAHVAIQVARHWNCRVFVFTRARRHQELARELGAEWVGRAGDAAPEPLDSSVVFAPAGWIVPHALGALDRGGTVALAGIHMSPIPETPYERVYGERTLTTVANCTRRDAAELLDLAGRIPIRTWTRSYELGEANRALEDVKESRIEAAAVLTMGD